MSAGMRFSSADTTVKMRQGASYILTITTTPAVALRSLLATASKTAGELLHVQTCPPSVPSVLLALTSAPAYSPPQRPRCRGEAPAGRVPGGKHAVLLLPTCH